MGREGPTAQVTAVPRSGLIWASCPADKMGLCGTPSRLHQFLPSADTLQPRLVFCIMNEKPFHSDNYQKGFRSSAFHNSAERYDPPKCHPHTREAVLKRIMLWVDDLDNEAQIMWMFGPAGAGKSAIAQSIAEMCFQQGKLAASFFFSRNASGSDSETRFISTPVYQLVLAISEIQDAVNKALEDDRLLLSRLLNVQAQNLITKPLNDLLTSSSENGFQNPRPRLIIVDGLDECGKVKNQRYALDVLSTITRELTYPLLFLVASRPEQVIRDSFSKESMCSITTRLGLDDTYKPTADIDRRNRSKFSEITQQERTFQVDGRPTETFGG